MSGPTLFLAGGGTGGHVYPLLAVADAVRELRPDVQIVFIGTERGLESRVVPERGYTLALTRVIPLRGGGLRGLIRGIFAAGASLPEATLLIDEYEPRAVLSVGGYAAGPVSLIARIASVPLALIEPNSVMGLSNRLVAPLARRAYVEYESVQERFGPGIALRTGVPIRPGFEPQPLPSLSDGASLLILGGSQGAQSLNERVPEALALTRRNATPIGRIVHQAGRGKDAVVRRRYESLGIEADVVPFIDDVPTLLRESHLVISRAGASALAEICAVGRPSLLFPYPFAADDHQTVNAADLARHGATCWMPDRTSTPEAIATQLEQILGAPAVLERMAIAATGRGRPHAAHGIAEDLLGLADLTLPAAPKAAGAPPGSGVGGGAH